MCTSRTLFLTICSNHKTTGGSPRYDPQNSIPKLLPDLAQGLLEHRNRIRQLIMRGDIIISGVPINEMPYNARLAQGGDMGGTSSSLYLAAVLRYQGRYYTELGADRLKRLHQSPHHMLIISGLYGLLTPDELIQGYTCHVLHHPEIASTWTKKMPLTSLLLAYIRLFGIQRVFDLTAQRAYRDLLDWSRISGKARVLHVFGETNAGPDLLPALGQATLQWLSEDETKLESIKAGDTYVTGVERLAFTIAPTPPPGFPVESAVAAPATQVANEGEETLSMIEVEVSAKPRDIPITSGEDRTAFGVRVQSVADCPREVREFFTTISRVVHVMGIKLGRMEDSGPKPRFLPRIAPPRPGMGQIDGKVTGPFAVCSSQDFRIAVTRGQEEPVYRAILRLLNEKDAP